MVSYITASNQSLFTPVDDGNVRSTGEYRCLKNPHSLVLLATVLLFIVDICIGGITLSVLKGTTNAVIGGTSVTSDGFIVSADTHKDVSVMTRKPLFPVYAGVDLDRTLRNRELSTNDDLKNGEAVLFGDKISYIPLGTIDEMDVKTFFSHIASTGDGTAECKTDLGGFVWSYDIDFPVNGFDPESKVYFGTGYNANSIPFVSEPVIIVDCNEVHSKVCIAGEAKSDVLPFPHFGPGWSGRSLLSSKQGIEKIGINSYKEDEQFMSRQLSGYRRSRARHLLDATFWELDEIANCWTADYELALYSMGHLFIAAIPHNYDISDPSNKSSSCPIIAVDAGYSQEEAGKKSANHEENPKTLSKHVLVVNDLPKDGVLHFGNRMKLRNFYNAVEAARTTSEESSSFDITANNCATFPLDVMSGLHINYKGKDMYRDLVNYIVDGLMKSDKTKEHILGAVKEKTSSTAGATGRMLHSLRSERAVMKSVVESYIKMYSSV